MKDTECVEFLQWCLPRLTLRWAGFRKVRGQVCKRIGRRTAELGLPGLPAYREYLMGRDEEWRLLDSMCRISISRFYRDRGVFAALGSKILPLLGKSALRRGESEVRCWSAGCGSGEEPYTLQLLWKLSVSPALPSAIPLRIAATDADPALLERARKGCYPESSLKDLPEDFRLQAFINAGDSPCLRDAYKEDIDFLRQDIRERMPEGGFHIILCRNLVLTYFEDSLQREITERLLEKLHPGGVFVVGIHEALPQGITCLRPCGRTPAVYRKLSTKRKEIV
jgi:chemotaxis protein methyltransferase CheR